MSQGAEAGRWPHGQAPSCSRVLPPHPRLHSQGSQVTITPCPPRVTGLEPRLSEAQGSTGTCGWWWPGLRVQTARGELGLSAISPRQGIGARPHLPAPLGPTLPAELGEARELGGALQWEQASFSAGACATAVDIPSFQVGGEWWLSDCWPSSRFLSLSGRLDPRPKSPWAFGSPFVFAEKSGGSLLSLADALSPWLLVFDT